MMRDGLKTIAAPEATELAPLNECDVLMHCMKCMTGSINSTLGHPDPAWPEPKQTQITNSVYCNKV